MHLFCRLGKHRLPPFKVWNQGRYFAHCADCGSGLVQQGRDWYRVPRGFRIVWRPRRSCDAFYARVPCESGRTLWRPLDLDRRR